MKNNAMLIAGKTIPTIGTKIEGKNAAAIFLSQNNFFNK
jgi:hypothetical protein